MTKELRINLLLSLGGCVIGAVLVGIVYLINPMFFKHLAAGRGATFESIDDLRKQMTQRDSRDRLGGGEVSLRAILRPNPSDQIIYELQPDTTAQFRHVAVRINHFGMRGDDVALEKSPGTFRIALLGDSYTFGWGVDQDQIFAKGLADNLSKLAPGGKKVEVLNFGVPGYGTFQEVAQYLESGQKFQPDAIVVYFISNDFGLPFFIKDLEDPAHLLPATDFNRTSLKPEDKEKLEKRKKLLESLDANRPLLQLALDCKKKNIALFLAIHPDHKAAEMRRRLWTLRKRPGSEIIKLLWLNTDFDSAVEAKEVPVESLTIPHDNHPGAGAHKIIGEILARQMAERLWPSATDPGQ